MTLRTSFTVIEKRAYRNGWYIIKLQTDNGIDKDKAQVMLKKLAKPKPTLNEPNVSDIYPVGEITLSVAQESLANLFELGVTYFVDFMKDPEQD